MLLHLVSVKPLTALPVFARLYGCSEQDFKEMTNQMTAAWIAQDGGGEALGAVGLRPSPTHRAEVMGGAFPGPVQHETAVALIKAALATQSHLYAYAEAHLLPEETLKIAGLHLISAYTRMTGPLPSTFPVVPDGFKIVPLWEVGRLEDRFAAEQTYSDRIGHTLVTAEAVQPDVGGTDDRLGRLAYDASGVPAGVCRASLQGEEVLLETPGVRPDARGTGLRQTLLLSVSAAARAAGATRLVLEARGDTAVERAEDEALGLGLEEYTPIYSSVTLEPTNPGAGL